MGGNERPRRRGRLNGQGACQPCLPDRREGSFRLRLVRRQPRHRLRPPLPRRAGKRPPGNSPETETGQRVHPPRLAFGTHADADGRGPAGPPLLGTHPGSRHRKPANGRRPLPHHAPSRHHGRLRQKPRAKLVARQPPRPAVVHHDGRPLRLRPGRGRTAAPVPHRRVSPLGRQDSGPTARKPRRQHLRVRLRPPHVFRHAGAERHHPPRRPRHCPPHRIPASGGPERHRGRTYLDMAGPARPDALPPRDR